VIEEIPEPEKDKPLISSSDAGRRIDCNERQFMKA
jgi:hypothetical protein